MRRAVLALGIVAALAATTYVPTTAADPAPRPVVADDRVVVLPYVAGPVEVLGNDGGGDPAAADLLICRLEPPPQFQAWIQSHDGDPGAQGIRPGSTFLNLEGPYWPPRGFSPGDHLLQYAACDRERLAWATLTLDVRRVGVLRDSTAPGTIRFSNPLDQVIDVVWSRVGQRKGHAFRLGAGQSRSVRTGPAAVRWYAGAGADSESTKALQSVDQGTVRAAGSAGTSEPLLSGATAPARLADPVENASAPVTAPDRVTFDYTGYEYVDVLANDGDDRPGDLAICRVDVPTGSRITVLPDPWWTGGTIGDPQTLAVATDSTEAGSYEITYYACDRELLTPGTLTVTVREFPLPLVRRVAGQPGVVSFRNRGYRTIRVEVFPAGRRGGGVVDVLAVRPGKVGRVRVDYDTLAYTVETKVGWLTNGTVKDVQQRR